MKYDIVWNANLNDLIQDVNELMKQGWKPLGGLSQSEAAFYQAMIFEVKF